MSDFNLPENKPRLVGCTNWVSFEVANRLRAHPVPSGSILLPKIGAALLGNARRIATMDSLFDNNVMAVVPRSIESRYLYYWLSTIDMKELAQSGPVPSLSESVILDLPVPINRQEGQRAIADFLDRETARIDTLVGKKKRMIEVLREGTLVEVEQRLRDSPSSEIPFRRLLREPPQYGAGESGEVGDESWPRYIRITDLTADGALRDDDVRRLPPDVATPYLLVDGDLLFARSGATVGKAFIYREAMGPCCFAGYLIRFRIDRTRIAPEIVEAWTRTGHYWGQIRTSSIQATIENVSAERYKNLLIPVPSKENQAGIMKLFGLRRERSRRLEQRLHDQVVLLQEHRQALITAAVTGQMDIPSTA